MPVLILKSKNTVIERISLDRDKSLNIGVLADNDLVIDDPAISGHHAEIEAEGDYFYITDRQSRNGTFINDELIISRPLKQGDVISMGEHILEFFYEEGETVPSDAKMLNVRMTMALDTEQHRSKLAHSVSRLADESNRKKTIAVLSYMDGSNGSLPLETFPVKLGKAADNDIQIKGFGVGKTAAIINRKNDEYRLTAAEGLSKPKVNYQTVKNEIALQEFDVIEIGSSQFQFHFQSVYADDGHSE
ncbi:FHA domain protein [delta proteobacterium NaphS2]|nr:FHA domain protein [delta proteobacterium NaphS2]